jgi:hypothetical protein
MNRHFTGSKPQKGQGVSDSTFRGTIGTDDDDNVGAPPRWAAWMNASRRGGAFTPIASSSRFIPTPGGGRGTVGLWNDETLFPGTATPHQLEWASYVGNEVNDDMVANRDADAEHAWSDRANPTFARSDFAFGEINDAVIGGEFDATILEVAFHDSATDAELMRDAKVRNWVARGGRSRAAVRYFNQYSGNADQFPARVTDECADRPLPAMGMCGLVGCSGCGWNRRASGDGLRGLPLQRWQVFCQSDCRERRRNAEPDVYPRPSLGRA